jgi:hypothetical protein
MNVCVFTAGHRTKEHCNYRDTDRCKYGWTWRWWVSFDKQLYNVKGFRFRPNVKLFVHKILKKIYFIPLYYGLDNLGFGVQLTVGQWIFSRLSRLPLRPTHPPIQWVPEAISLEVMWPGREADQSSPTSAEVNKMWIYTSTPPYVFMMSCFISQALDLNK